MGLWWLLLITISLASGDLQSYNVYDPDDEDIAFGNNEENYQRGIQQNVNHNFEIGFAPIKRSNREDDQGKRQQRFHSWGGKRYEQKGTKGDGYNVKESIHEPDKEEESYFSPENVSLNMLNFVKYGSLMIPRNKRTKQPAFSSWGGKRNLKVIKQDEKKSNYDSVFQSGLFKTRMAEQNRKRYPAFNSWAGKRNAASNRWGEKRVPAFNSWGGKRGAAFNSRGGKRDAAFNSGGRKRAAAFNSWGGKRTVAFNSWAEKRAAAFNSWGGKRGWNEKSVLQMNSMEGKEALDIHEENRIFETNCILFQPRCTDMCVRFKNLKKERSLYDSGFDPGDLILRIENICHACQCSWNEKEINKQLISHLLEGKISFPCSFRNFINLEKRKKVFQKIKKHVLDLLIHKIDKELIRFLEPAVNMNDSKYEDESKLNQQYEGHYSVRRAPKDILKYLSDEIISTAEEELERNRDFTFNSNIQKRTGEFQNTDNPRLENSTQSFVASLDITEQNKEIPGETKYFSTKTSIYHDANTDNKNEINEDYIKYLTDNRDEIYQNENIKYTSNQPEYHGMPNWDRKRSPIFHTWYENKVPAIQLSNGKRRPAFSSWGGKRSGHPIFQDDSEECTSSNEGKTCINTMENFNIEPGNNLSDEDHKSRQKRNITLNKQNNSVLGTTYENTLNRDKRSNRNMKKNKDITRLVLQGGFAWPMMVKSFPKGVDFYAWGGKR